MRVARRYLISGRVQGVGFRVFTEAQAAVEGLHGWVRNLGDGRVEALFEGDVEAVDRAEAKLRRGPAGARIEDHHGRQHRAVRPGDRIPHPGVTRAPDRPSGTFPNDEQRLDGRTQIQNPARP